MQMTLFIAEKDEDGTTRMLVDAGVVNGMLVHPEMVLTVDNWPKCYMQHATERTNDVDAEPGFAIAGAGRKHEITKVLQHFRDSGRIPDTGPNAVADYIGKIDKYFPSCIYIEYNCIMEITSFQENICASEYNWACVGAGEDIAVVLHRLGYNMYDIMWILSGIYHSVSGPYLEITFHPPSTGNLNPETVEIRTNLSDDLTLSHSDSDKFLKKCQGSIG